MSAYEGSKMQEADENRKRLEKDKKSTPQYPSKENGYNRGLGKGSFEFLNQDAPQEIKTDDNLINHMRNIKLLKAIYSGKKFYVECSPTDKGAMRIPYSNLAITELELPDFNLYEEKLGYKWIKSEDNTERQELINRIQQLQNENRDLSILYDAAKEKVYRYENLNEILKK